VAAVCALFGASLTSAAVVQAAPASTVVTQRVADSGPISVPACPGTTSNSAGSMNTPQGFVLPEGSGLATALREGKTIMLYGNHGTEYLNSEGENDSRGQGGLPYCGARLLDSGELEVDWRFCTDQGKAGCAHLPPSSEWTGTPTNPLNVEQRLQIANILMDARLATKRDRALVQLQVWCVSDDWAEGSVNTSAQNYFNSHDFSAASSSNPEARHLTTDEARCNYLPDLVQEPELSVAGPAAELAAGDTGQFTVTTNITTPVLIGTAPDTTIKLCPVEQRGVTFDGRTLQLDEGGTATLCATLPRTGTLTVTADSGDLPQAGELGLLWNGDTGCQVFADYIQGSAVRIERSASARFVGTGTFQVAKTFAGVSPSDGDLDDAAIAVSYAVTGGPALPSGTPESGTLLLNAGNGFTATGPSYPDGTVVVLEERSVTGLPASLEQVSAAWSVDGSPVSGGEVTITVGDGRTAALVLENTLAALIGTFEVRKDFAFDNGSTTPPPGIEVEVLWWVKGQDQSTAQVIVLNEDNGFAAFPGADQSTPELFPVGTTILLEEVEQTLPGGISNVVDWGSNTDPDYTGTGNRGMVTIAQAWNPDEHTPGGNTTAAEVSLTNGVAINRGSLTVQKLVAESESGATEPGVGEGPFDDLEIAVTATWSHPDPLVTAAGSNVLLLNESNGWRTGLGVDLPDGTVVTLEETGIYSSDPSISWDEEPSWSCATCIPPLDGVVGGTQSVVITDGQGPGQPIADLSISLTNTYRVLMGSFSVEKLVSGDIDREDPRLDGITFIVNWESTDQARPEGAMSLTAPSWVANPSDADGAVVRFPIGTTVFLDEVDPPAIPGVVWGEDPEWSVGDEGTDAAITIVSEDTPAGPEASLMLTNRAELHEGSFSVAKFVHSIAPADVDGVRFEVTYRSTEPQGEYEGSLFVVNDEEAFSESFPAGTVIVLDEVLPAPLEGTTGWETPVFVDQNGDALSEPVTITVGDGTDVRLNLINTTVEPPSPTPPAPTPPAPDPSDPQTPGSGSATPSAAATAGGDLARTGVGVDLGMLILIALVLGTTGLALRRRPRQRMR
ncbi:MAG: DUF5979 domain-containing protein, partial [Mycetocola sp.]